MVIGYYSDVDRDPDWILQQQCDAFRATVLGQEPPAHAVAFKGIGLLEFADAWARRKYGHLNPGSIGERVKLALTSDFPQRLADVQTAIALDVLRVADPAYKYVSEELPADAFRDYRSTVLTRASEFPGLVQVGESGEVSYGVVPDVGERVQVVKYGRRSNFSWEALINGDLQRLRTDAIAVAERVSELKNNVILGRLRANPTMADGVAFFHSSRGNLAGSPGVFSLTSYGVACAALKRMTSQAGAALNFDPAAILCGPDTAVTIRSEVAKLPVAAQVPVVADALLGTDWYVISKSKPLRHGTLNGQPMVFAEQSGFASDGIDFKVTVNLAVCALEPRCVFKNAGA